MSIIEDLENLVKIWNERCTYQGLQAREAFDVGDTKLQDTLISNRKQIGNCILDLTKVLRIEKERNKSCKAIDNKLEDSLNAGRMY